MISIKNQVIFFDAPSRAFNLYLENNKYYFTYHAFTINVILF